MKLACRMPLRSARENMAGTCDENRGEGLRRKSGDLSSGRCIEDRFDVAVIISNDSDLKEPIAARPFFTSPAAC